MVRPLNIGMTLVTAFDLVSWAMHGFPTKSSAKSSGELKPTLNATFGKDSRSEEEKARRTAQTLASAQDPELNKIRLETLAAANAYALQANCESAAKERLIAALTAYTKAWQRKLNCFRPMLIFMMFCDDENMSAAAAAFSTHLDNQIKEALDEAFDRRGILQSEFPYSVRFDVLQFAGSNLWADESPVCMSSRRRAERPR
jgi:hypothetical protein